MREITLSSRAVAVVSGSSKGTQPKYYEDGYWYKKNTVGYEGLSEHLVSLLLSCSNIKKYVSYDECMIDGRKGCRSKSFLSEEEIFVSFQRLFDMFEGGDLMGKILPMDDVAKRIDYVKDFVIRCSGIDVSDYISKICSLACLILNTDLHFHNMGLIMDQKRGTFREAPAFDHGRSLLSDWNLFCETDLEENIQKAVCQPFSSSFEKQAYFAGFSLKIDYDRFYLLTAEMERTRALEVLKYQMERYEKEFRKDVSTND